MNETIEVDGISDELPHRLDERARQIGVDGSSYVRRHCAGGCSSQLCFPGRTSGSVHDYTDAQRIPEEEIERFFSSQLKGARQRRPELTKVANPPSKPRCVFTAACFFRPLFHDAFARLNLVEAGRLELLLCDSALAELREALTSSRPAEVPGSNG